jgi:two-component system NtrC family sensor kinase
MQLSKDTSAGRALTAIVVAAVMALVAGALLIGVLTAREISAVVTEQFNAQQMVIAQALRARIERELNEVRHEIRVTTRLLGAEAHAPVAELLRQNLARTEGLSASQADLVDRAAGRATACTPAGACADQAVPAGIPYERLRFRPGENPPTWVSDVQVAAGVAALRLAGAADPDAARVVVVTLNLTTLLPGLMRNVTSGKTGYAWVIDDRGIFLYHPNPDFVGHNAFTIREERFPEVPAERINFIQQEKMLRGEQGTGWYYGAWHRGTVGQNRKLIAYCPVRVGGDPPTLWSVAVVALESEVEDVLHSGSVRLLALVGIVILALILGGAAIYWIENRWGKMLEAMVVAKTDALAKSEENYRSLVESAEDLIFTVDRDGCFQSMNTFTAHFFGGHPEQFIGRPLSAAFPEPGAERQLDLVRRVHASGKSLREEFELPLEGGAVWISANFMPVKSPAGEVGTILCIARDVTETKNLQRQLVNAEKLASLGTLAAGVAHEINNPLGVILGFCELLLRKTDPSSQQYEDLRTIERQGLLCKETVENLLSFARTEKQRRGESCDLNACVGEIAKIVRHLLGKNGIELVLQLDPQLPPVRGDARQLQQVFLNLITNALAAMEDGGTLEVRSFFERTTRRVVVQFQDTGAGIRPDHMDRIFEPFFTTKPDGQGTGLGLFVSYGIITGYGGVIECESLPATATGKRHGTTFTIKLLTGSAENPEKREEKTAQ